MSTCSTPLLISIEGGIGAGKSTLLSKLKVLFKDAIGIAFVDEPAAEWTEHGFLQAMYKGTISRATFQHMALMSLAGDLLKTLVNDRPIVIISERSPWGARAHSLTTNEHALRKHTHPRTLCVCAQETTTFSER
tara:strand:- start:5664 stop:6065 length:402 start_codon:yes stop_codon:yes gene_type:complete